MSIVEPLVAPPATMAVYGVSWQMHRRLRDRRTEMSDTELIRRFRKTIQDD